MRRSLGLVAAATALALVPAVALAQDPADEAARLRARVKGLEARVERLEARLERQEQQLRELAERLRDRSSPERERSRRNPAHDERGFGPRPGPDREALDAQRDELDDQVQRLSALLETLRERGEPQEEVARVQAALERAQRALAGTTPDRDHDRPDAPPPLEAAEAARRIAERLAVAKRQLGPGHETVSVLERLLATAKSLHALQRDMDQQLAGRARELKAKREEVRVRIGTLRSMLDTARAGAEGESDELRRLSRRVADEERAAHDELRQAEAELQRWRRRTAGELTAKRRELEARLRDVFGDLDRELAPPEDGEAR